MYASQMLGNTGQGLCDVHHYCGYSQNVWLQCAVDQKYISDGLQRAVGEVEYASGWSTKIEMGVLCVVGIVCLLYNLQVAAEYSEQEREHNYDINCTCVWSVNTQSKAQKQFYGLCCYKHIKSVQELFPACEFCMMGLTYVFYLFSSICIISVLPYTYINTC